MEKNKQQQNAGAGPQGGSDAPAGAGSGQSSGAAAGASGGGDADVVAGGARSAAVQGGGGGSQGAMQPGAVGSGATGGTLQKTGSRDQNQRTMGVIRPPVDVIEDAQGITLLADMPGVSKDNLNLRLDAHSLTIEGSMALDLPAQMEGRYIEVGHQHYERTFALSRELDGGQATAELSHGVVKIRIPKTREAAPRKIPVSVV